MYAKHVVEGGIAKRSRNQGRRLSAVNHRIKRLLAQLLKPDKPQKPKRSEKRAAGECFLRYVNEHSLAHLPGILSWKN
jgi:hypothetical protein